MSSGHKCRHQRKGYGLARKAEDLGVKILTGTTVKGFKSANSSTAITAVETDKGTILCNQVIVGEVLNAFEQLGINPYFIVRLHPKSDKSDYN